MGEVADRDDGLFCAFCIAGKVSVREASEAGMAYFRNVEVPELRLLNTWPGRLAGWEVGIIDVNSVVGAPADVEYSPFNLG